MLCGTRGSRRDGKSLPPLDRPSPLHRVWETDMSQGESRGALMERVREAVYDRLDTHLNPVQIATQAADIAVDEVLAAIHERDYTAGDSSDEEVLGIYRHLIRTIYGWMR